MMGADWLCVRSGDALLLNEVSVRMASGKVTAIVGPNGAGKSTLLSCLAGLREPDGGGVRLSERPMAEWSVADRARTIGYLPQDSAVHWNVGVRALVALGRYPHRRGMAGETQEDVRAIHAALTATGMEAFANRSVNSLSGGERARAMIARVLATEPRWILADEPLAALDIAHRHEVMHLLAGVAAQGIGVVIVLHDLALARRMADTVLLLHKGRLVASGKAGEVLSPDVLSPVFGVPFELLRGADGSETLVASPPLSSRP